MNLKNDSAICCLQQAHFKCNNNTGRLKIQGLEKIHYVNIIKRKQEWLYVYQIKLTWEQSNLPETGTLYDKWETEKEDTAILNMLYQHQSCKICQVKPIQLEGETHESTMIAEYSETPLSTTDRTITQIQQRYRRNQQYH